MCQGSTQRPSQTFMVDHHSHTVKSWRVCHDTSRAELSRADISLKDISISSGQQESLPYLIQASSLFKWDIYWKTLQQLLQVAECRETALREWLKMEMWKQSHLRKAVVGVGLGEDERKNQGPFLFSILFWKKDVFSRNLFFSRNLYSYDHRMCPK